MIIIVYSLVLALLNESKSAFDNLYTYYQYCVLEVVYTHVCTLYSMENGFSILTRAWVNYSTCISIPYW